MCTSMLYDEILHSLVLIICADGDDWENRWVGLTKKGSDQGKFVLTAGKFYGDAEKDKGKSSNFDSGKE